MRSAPRLARFLVKSDSWRYEGGVMEVRVDGGGAK